MAGSEHAGRVLLVDDSPFAIDMLQDALREQAWEIASALNVNEALELVRRWKPDVVVSDLYMPDMDGLTFLQRLREVDPVTPVVMTSGEENLSVVLRAVRAGVYDYVPKNGDTQFLAAAVARAADHARALRDNERLASELRRANQELEQRVSERTTQLTSANQELQNLMSKLISSERLAAIGQLAGGIAHEVNNPLSYVLSNLTYVRYSLSDMDKILEPMPAVEAALQARRKSAAGRTYVQEMQQALVEAEDGAKRISEIVRDVRVMSRTDDRSRGRFDVNTAIRSATRIAGEQIRRRAKLQLELGQAVDVIGSVGRVTQVMVNLLVNAADALEGVAGRDHIIKVVSLRDEGGVLVRVSDDGSGIEAEQLGRIFDPFFTTKPKGRGTGMGLSICQDIVQNHGGRITVESTLGVGTTFTIQLPSA